MQFDWVTFAFQLVNVLILAAILKYFLFKPVAAIIARRRAEQEEALAGAQAARAEAEQARKEALAAAQVNDAARHDLLAKARTEAEAGRLALLEAARGEAARIIADARTQAAEAGLAAEAASLDRARDLAEAIAERALAGLPVPPDALGYARRLAATLTIMTQTQRSAFLSGGGLKLIAPQALNAEMLAQVEALLAPLGANGFEIEINPDLILGLELQSQSGVLHNSLAHDLTRISEALAHGDGSGA